MMRFLLLLYVLLPLTLQAAMPLEDFGSLPIAHAGRVKPLSVFAREQLQDFSGAQSWHKQPATHWLAAMIFTPEAMENTRIIQVESAALRSSLNLTPHAANLYTIEELRLALRPALPQILAAMLLLERDRPLTALQEKQIDLFQRIRRFQQLQDSLNPNIPKERQRQNPLLAVLPSVWKDGQWFSAWQIAQSGKGSPQTAALAQNWQAMRQSYRAGNVQGWNTAITAAGRAVRPFASPLRLTLEELYYRFSPLSLAVIGYGLFLITSPIGRGRRALAMREREALTRLRLRLRRPLPMGEVLLFIAIALHGSALLIRMLILGRPPVSNLYESLLFVSLLVVIGAAFSRLKWLQLLGAFTAAALLLISQTLLAGQEQLPVVMAVLNTNFWLGTHVVCITAGYAAALLVSLLAHISLYQRSTQPKSLTLLALIALLLTAVGTLLGGIWADQSWGRFWGWDPKENGALLIVLWLIWVLHGRLTGQLSERATLAGLAAVSIMVALAWFGVNLLSVGLHSYGFMEGTALGLFGFIALEIAAISGLWWRSCPKSLPA